jgi:undecaprenyl diphosphate synthase
MTLEAPKTNGVDQTLQVPQHVAIIMDGNGRWAQQQGLPRLEGHRAGTENIRRILESLDNRGVSYVTLFAFSTENWGRPDTEVSGLLEILQSVLHDQVRDLHAQNVRIRHLGMLERLPGPLSQAISAAVKLTANNTGLNLSVAFDYGGRSEIVDAIRRIVETGVSPDEVTEASIHEYLYLPEIPDPDLIIRTGGEQRLSNFLIWQAAYSEFYQTPAFWPDFDDAEVANALEEYGQRKRRFGRLPSEDPSGV